MPKEVLEKAIQKAIDGGWQHQVIAHPELFTSLEISDAIGRLQNHPNDFIFSHDFAKALWGEYGAVPEARYPLRYKKGSGVERTKIIIVASHVSPWQYHLQQMVIAPDPIKYLGDNI